MTDFPSREKFFSRLKNQNVSSEVYEKTKRIFLEYDCKNLLDLVKIYQMRY